MSRALLQRGLEGAAGSIMATLSAEDVACLVAENDATRERTEGLLCQLRAARHSGNPHLTSDDREELDRQIAEQEFNMRLLTEMHARLEALARNAREAERE
jgi:hypothetical protein